MSELRSFFSRPGAALGNLQYGLSPAVQTLHDPEKLPPHMRKTVAERLGVEGLWGGLLNTLSDPLTAMAVITSFILPLPTVSNLKKLGQKFKGFEKAGKNRMSTMHWIQSGHSFMFNTPIAEVFDELLTTDLGFRGKFANRAGELVNKYVKAKGRKWNELDDVLLGAWLDGLHKGKPSGFSDKIRGRAMLKADGAWTKDKDFLELAKGFRKVYDDVYAEVFMNPESRASLRTALKKSHEKSLKQWKEVERARLRAEGKTGPEATEIIRQKLAQTLEPGSKEWVAWFDEKVASKRKDYFNRIMSKRDPTGTNSREFLRFLEEEDALRAGGEVQQYVEQALYGRFGNRAGASGPNPPSWTQQRKGRMLPHVDDMKILHDAGLLDERAYQDYRQLVRKNNYGPEALNGGARDPIGMYTLGASNASATYIHEYGKLAGWTLKGHGERLMSLYHQLDPNRPEHKAIKKAMEDLYIPAALGRTTKKAYERQAIWMDRIEQASQIFGSDISKKLLGEKRAAALQKRVLDSVGVPILDPVTRRVSNWLYTSTLGGNLSSAFRNMFQLILTTGPVLGPEAMVAGTHSYMKKMGTFLDEFKNTKNSDKAFEKAFPEYARAGIPGSVVLDDSFYSLKEAMEQGTFHGLRGKVWSPVRDALMFPFSLSEKSVRAITFEGARLKALKEFSKMDKHLLRAELAPIEKVRGLKPGTMKSEEGAIWLAGKITQDTQFLSGPLNTPKAFANLGPLTRQLAHFPSRYLEYLTTAGPRMLRPTHYRNPLNGFQKQAFEKGLGPEWAGAASFLSRAYLWSDLTSAAFMEVSKGLGIGDGINMDQSLMPGAVPGMGRGPFGIFPFQPPAWAIGGSIAKDLSEGEFNETRYALPLMVPGGVAAARAIGAVPTRGAQEAARFLNRKYVDYDTPGPDGSYATYNGQGTFLGYLQPTDIMLMGSGVLEGGSKLQTIQESQQFLMKNREQIINSKRQFIEALVRGNYDTMNKTDAQFQSVYGASIRNFVSESDIERAQDRRTIGGIEKVLDTIPTYMRPMYLQAIETVMQSNPDLVGVDPAAFNQWSGMTSKQRTPWRHRPAIVNGSPYPGTAKLMHQMRNGGDNSDTGVGMGNNGGNSFNPNMGPFSQFNPYARSRAAQGGDRSVQERQGFRPTFQSFTNLNGFGG
jgi:hypothetical protein